MEERVRVSVLVPWANPAAKLVESVFLGIGGGWTREVVAGAWRAADGRVFRDDHWRYACDLKPSVAEDLAGGLEAFVEAFAADVARAAGELETYVTVERVLVASVPPSVGPNVAAAEGGDERMRRVAEVLDAMELGAGVEFFDAEGR